MPKTRQLAGSVVSTRMRKVLFILFTAGVLFVVWSRFRPLPKANFDALIINSANPQKLINGSLEDAPVWPAPVYVLYFSASWCGPCRQAAPRMIDWFKSNAGSGEVAFIMVSLDESREQAAAYLLDMGMPWPFVMGTDIPSDILQLGGNSIPKTVVLDRTGQVLSMSQERGKYRGPFEPLKFALPK